MPAWTMAVGQIISYASCVPLIGVTVFSLVLYIKGSGMKWDLPVSLLVLGTIGWGIGALPAIIDGMVAVNKVMHNTQWVPGHFHTYMLLGEVAMAFGFAAWLVRDPDQQHMSDFDRLVFRSYVAGGVGFVLIFLWSGASSIPRRWAVHYPEWQFQSQLATVFAAIVAIATLGLVLRYVQGLVKARRRRI